MNIVKYIFETSIIPTAVLENLKVTRKGKKSMDSKSITTLLENGYISRNMVFSIRF
jgi:hypothetical protein